MDTDAYHDGLNQGVPYELEFADLKNKNFIVVDIRELEETTSEPYRGDPCIQMPLSAFDPNSLDGQNNYAFFCKSGRRSLTLVRALREKGMKNVCSLIGGINKSPDH